MKTKPIIFVVMNIKGGLGKSALAALAYHVLKLTGRNPLVVALDTNRALLNQIMIPDPDKEGSFLEKPEIFTWDINAVEENRRVLPAVIQKAYDEGRPVIIDLPAKGGQTLGIFNLLRTGALRYGEVIGLAPIRKGDLSVAGAIEAYEDINPHKWIQVNFGPEPKIKPQDEDLTDLSRALAELKPSYNVWLELLHEDEARELSRQLPVPFSQLSDNAMAGGPAMAGLHVIAEYWEQSMKKLEAAFRAVVPRLFAADAGSIASGEPASEKVSTVKLKKP